MENEHEIATLLTSSKGYVCVLLARINTRNRNMSEIETRRLILL